MTGKEEGADRDRVDVQLVEKAVSALLAHHEKTVERKEKDTQKRSLLGTDSAVQLQIGLEVAPVNPSPKPIRIKIPHALHRVVDGGNSSDREGDNDGSRKNDGLDERVEVCLIVKEESKEWVQEVIRQHPAHMGCIRKVLGLQSLRKKHAQFQQRRALLHRFDVFLADDRILPMLASSLGKVFFKAKKHPIPVRLTRHKQALPLAIYDVLTGSTFLTLSAGTTLTVRVGNTAMAADRLVENIAAACEGVGAKVPRKWANVRSFAIKTSDSVSLPIYNRTPEQLMEIARMAGIEQVWKTQDELENRIDDNDDEEEAAKVSNKLKSKSPLLLALKKQKELQKLEGAGEQDKEEAPEEGRLSKQRDNNMAAMDETNSPDSEKSKDNSRGEQKVEQYKTNAKERKKRKKERKESSKDSPAVREDAEEGDKFKTPSKKKRKHDKKEKTSDAKEREDEEKTIGDMKESEGVAEEKKKPFVAAKRFKGSKPGYVFKKGDEGLGYYIDDPPVVDAAALKAILRAAAAAKHKKSKKRNKNKSPGSGKTRRDRR